METQFQKKAYKITRMIPKGKVATYGQIAQLAGKPNASRAIGRFMKINPYAPHVPCHRVVGAGGVLAGYALGGIEAKKKLLKREGVTFMRNRVNLLKSQWKTV